jgi:hypothetical protein
MVIPKEHSDTVDIPLWVARVMILAGALGLLAIVVSTVANATECSSRPKDDSYWSWRYVKPYDHKRCWYKGKHMVPKSQLHWPNDQDRDDEQPKPQKHKLKMQDPIFPPKNQVQIKVFRSDEYNELDAQADSDLFFHAKPMTFWPSVTPFTPWTERVAGAFQ